MGVEVSLVIPAYNEESNIEEAVDSALDELSRSLGGEFEVIIVEDGCTDNTEDLAQQLRLRDRVRHIHFNERKGRGRALEEAFMRSEGSTAIYMDADLSTDVQHLQELIEPVKDNEADITVGSRRMAESSADRRPLREFASWGYNNLAKLLLDSDVSDHQCGFKAFDRGAIENITDDIESVHWFWDTEVLVRAKENGYEVKEIPVKWDKSKASSVELLNDTFNMGTKLLKLSRKINQDRSVN